MLNENNTETLDHARTPAPKTEGNQTAERMKNGHPTHSCAFHTSPPQEKFKNPKTHVRRKKWKV